MRLDEPSSILASLPSDCNATKTSEQEISMVNRVSSLRHLGIMIIRALIRHVSRLEWNIHVVSVGNQLAMARCDSFQDDGDISTVSRPIVGLFWSSLQFYTLTHTLIPVVIQSWLCHLNFYGGLIGPITVPKALLVV